MAKIYRVGLMQDIENKHKVFAGKPYGHGESERQ
jgi:hypothetical protein